MSYAYSGPELAEMIATVNDNFAAYFRRFKCAGEVALSAKPNQEWGSTCAGGKASAAVKRTTPFTAPHA